MLLWLAMSTPSLTIGAVLIAPGTWYNRILKILPVLNQEGYCGGKCRAGAILLEFNTRYVGMGWREVVLTRTKKLDGYFLGQPIHWGKYEKCLGVVNHQLKAECENQGALATYKEALTSYSWRTEKAGD